ncbi:MAG: SdrD B-like domain-containing protein [Bacteroidota bacterium]
MKTKKASFLALAFIFLMGACSPAAIASPAAQASTPLESSGLAPRPTKPVIVENVEVVVGIGSPIPVEIVVGGTWPSLCSQIADVQSSIKDFKIDITILASMADSCPPDNVGLTFRFAIPLNVVELRHGTYTITVNGVSTSLDLPADLSKGTGAIFGAVWQDQCTNSPEGQPAPASPPQGCVDEISPVGPYHANGILDPNELPIEGVTVRLFRGDCASDSLVQVAETKTVASNISYSFTDLPAGPYCVYIGQQEDVNRSILSSGMWTYPTVTAKDITQTVNLEPAEGRYNVNFGWDDKLK